MGHGSCVNLAAPEKQYALQWADTDKTVMLFALESYKWGHMYIDGLWYAANTADWQWWNVSHAEPLLLRMYSGKSDRLADTVPALYAGREVIVPGMVDGNVEDLRLRRAKRSPRISCSVRTARSSATNPCSRPKSAV